MPTHVHHKNGEMLFAELIYCILMHLFTKKTQSSYFLGKLEQSTINKSQKSVYSIFQADLIRVTLLVSELLSFLLSEHKLFIWRLYNINIDKKPRKKLKLKFWKIEVKCKLMFYFYSFGPQYFQVTVCESRLNSVGELTTLVFS